MNTLQQQFDLISNDLARYGHISAAMESGNVVDLSNLRGEYTDIYHRYVTCQPHLFKRKALSVGTENNAFTATAAVGAVVLLGILYKLSKWIADFFFGGGSSSNPGGGSGGSKCRREVMLVVIGSHRITDIAKELASIAKELGNEKPTDDWIDKLSTNFKNVCSDSQVHTVKSWVDGVHAASRRDSSYVNPYVKMTRQFHSDATFDPTTSPDFEAFKQNYADAKESWEKAEDYMYMLKNHDSHVNSDLKNKSIATLLQNYVKFGEVFIQTRNYGFCDLPEILQIGIDGDAKQVKEIKEKHNDSANSKKIIALIDQMTHIKRLELKHVMYMSLLLGDYFDMAIHFCNLFETYADKLSDSSRSRVKELHAELIKLKKK